MTCSGLTASYAGFIVTRFLIGVFEVPERPGSVDLRGCADARRAGFFPGAIWTVSQRYPPQKTQGRMAMFYCASAASGAFSGLLAAGA